MPFWTATSEDIYYKLLINGRSDLFWKAHFAHQPQIKEISSNFKDLVTGMVLPNPHQRFSIADIIGHPWMQEGLPSKDELEAEFTLREQ